MFKPESGDAKTASSLLVKEVADALQARLQRIEAATATAPDTAEDAANTTSDADDLQVVSVLGAGNDSEIGTALQSGAAAAAAGAQAPLGVQAALLKASAKAARIARRSALVKAVIPDRVVRQVGTPCVDVIATIAGVSVTPLAVLRWPGCLSISTKLVWKGVTCGNEGVYIQWTSITAVDRRRSAVLDGGSLSINAVNATTKRRWFGGCGVPPTWAPTLPTVICRGSGQCTAGATPQVGILPRRSLVYGEVVPNGVARIEAYTTAAGVADPTAGQPVVVGVVDGGVDSTHPDLVYVSDTAWGTIPRRMQAASSCWHWASCKETGLAALPSMHCPICACTWKQCHMCAIVRHSTEWRVKFLPAQLTEKGKPATCSNMLEHGWPRFLHMQGNRRTIQAASLRTL